MKNNTTLALLVGVVFLDMLGIGVLIPIIPALFTDAASAFYILPAGLESQSLLLLGVMLAMYPMMQFFAAPILGDLSDHYGRKPLLAWSLLGTMIGYILFLVGLVLQSLPLLFISRALDGITGGNISVAQAAIADITAPEHRSKNFGLIGAAFGMGFILGPSIGGVLGHYSPLYPFILTTLLSLASVILVTRLLPETHQTKSISRKALSLFSSFRSVISGFRHPRLSKLFITTLLFSAGFTFFTSFFGAFLIEKFGFGEQAVGLYFAFVGIWIVITQAYINRKIAGRYSATILIQIPLIVLAAMLALYSVITAPWMLYAIVPFFAVSNGLVTANLSARISRSVGSSAQGEILGINASMNSVSQAIIPLVAGVIATTFSVSTPLIFGSIMVLLAAAVFAYANKDTL